MIETAFYQFYKMISETVKLKQDYYSATTSNSSSTTTSR